MQDKQEFALASLKFAGIFVSLVSGIVATAFETKEDGIHGSKHLSSFGKVVLSCVILGSLVSAITQLVEDHQKRVEATNAAAQKIQDVKRISYIIDGTQRIAHRIEPIAWEVQLRYRVDAGSPLSFYVQRIRAKDTHLTTFDMVGKYMPDPNDPREAGAWNDLMKPVVYIGLLKPEIFSGPAKNLPVPIVAGVSVLFAASEHADREGKWKPGPNATAPPFYSRLSFRENGGQLWLIQDFDVRNSPDATRISGVISPLDLSDFLVVAESGQSPNSFVDKVTLFFPTASGGIELNMTPRPPVIGFNRSIGVLRADLIRGALNIAAVP